MNLHTKNIETVQRIAIVVNKRTIITELLNVFTFNGLL